MDILFETIRDLLNSVIPSGTDLSLELASLNDFLAYALTLALLWSFLVKPIYKIFRMK